MRRIPVTEVDELELEAEKLWIYTYAFGGKMLSKQVIYYEVEIYKLFALVSRWLISCSFFR